MSAVWVTDATVVSGLGPDIDSTWRGLVEGRSAVRPIERFDASRYPARVASWIDGLEPEGGRSRLFPLMERVVAGLGPLPGDARLLTATTKGCIDTLERIQAGRPGDARDIPIATPVAWLARRLGLADTGVNINVACASSAIAVARAAAAIDAGLAEAVVVVCMDLVSEFVFSGFNALMALDPDGSRPFDRERKGLSLGEGGAALVLMSARRARREGRRALGVVAGWGMANDATHITAPARDGCGLIDAVRLALARAGVEAGEVAAINAHGTGTVYNDQMELTAFGAVFGARPIPLNSIKGAIGHTLGAAGGIEVAMGLRAVAERTLPPTAGFRASDGSSSLAVSAGPQAIGPGFLLSTNSGFGGVNAALLLGGEAA